jgi:hypothetical protein
VAFYKAMDARWRRAEMDGGHYGRVHVEGQGGREKGALVRRSAVAPSHQAWVTNSGPQQSGMGGATVV